MTEHILSKIVKDGAVSGEFVSREEFFKVVHRMMTLEDHKAQREEQKKIFWDYKLIMQKLGDDTTRALHELRRLEQENRRKAELAQLIKLEISLETYAK